MSISGESSDSEWKATKIKTKQNLKGRKKKYPQRFVESWIELFTPWLVRDAIDPKRPFCRVCNCRLNCNKCHMYRHEKTTKHLSNLETYIAANGMVNFKQNLGQKKDRRKIIKASSQTRADDVSKFDSIFMNIDLAGKRQNDEGKITQAENEGDESFPLLYDTNVGRPTSAARKENYTLIGRSNESGRGGKNDRKKLLLQIQKDKNELISSFTELLSNVSVENKERNHIDLFFDSVSSSVNALTPKLIAEAKMRVSQLVCELELRAITESESMNASVGPSSTVLLAVPSGNAYIINQNEVGSSQNHHSYEPTG